MFVTALLTCLFWLAGTGIVSAEVIKLKSGKTIEGTILFENEEVVVIRDAAGARYQYPKSDLVLEEPDEPAEAAQEQSVKAQQPGRDSELRASYADNAKKVSMGISMFGGGMVVPAQMVGEQTAPQMGGHAGADVMVGTYNLFKRLIFLGGATGFHAFMTDGKVLSIIPVMLRAEVPLTLKKHAPMLGMGVGYGIGLKNTKGGFCADVEFGWRYGYSRKAAFFMGVFADFQGVEIPVTETITGTEYTSMAYRNLCGFGAKMALFF